MEIIFRGRILIAIAFIFTTFNISILNAQIAIIQESFEGSQFPPQGWDTTTYSGNNWQKITGVASNGNACIGYQFHQQQIADAYIFSPPIFLGIGDTIYTKFDFRVSNSSYPENLRVVVTKKQNSATVVDTLWEQSGLTNTNWQSVTTSKFIAPTTDTYYVAFHCFSMLNMDTLYVDYVYVYRLTGYDGTPSALISPLPSCNPSSTVQAEIKNIGSQTLTNAKVYYRVNGSGLLDSVTISSLTPGQSTSITFSKPYNFQIGNIYNIDVIFYHLLDGNPLNDTLHYNLDLSISPPPAPWINVWTGNQIVPDNSTSGIKISKNICGLPQPLDGCNLIIKEVIIDSILHTWAADLDIYLLTPANDTIELSTGNGSNNDNYINVHLTDTASTSITGYAGNLGTSNHKYFKPEQPLSLAYGSNKNPNGGWSLWVRDKYPGDTGWILKWTIVFDTIDVKLTASGSSISQDTFCQGNNLTLSALVLPYSSGFSFTWTGPNNFISSNLSTTINNVNPTHSGTYYFTLKNNASQCTITDSIKILVLPSSHPQCLSTNLETILPTNNDIKIFPNYPYIILASHVPINQVMITTLSGKVIASIKNPSESVLKIPIPDIARIYCGIISLENGKIVFLKIPSLE